jgi:uncharacterized protein (DUF111 family)
MSDGMRLIMAQVDDVPGELLGEFIDRAEEIGARNVQIVPSVTKKSRPGYIVYIDIPAELENEIAMLLGAELGSWGYRVVAAEHKHFDIERHALRLTVVIADTEFEFDLRAKTIAKSGHFKRVKAEYDDLSAICTALRAAGHHVPLAELKAAVENELRKHEKPMQLAVRF